MRAHRRGRDDVSTLPMPIPSEIPIDPADLQPRRIPKLAVRKYIEGLEPPPHLRNVGLGLEVQSAQPPQRTNIDDQDDTITPIASRTKTRPDFGTRDSHNSVQSNDSDDTTQTERNPPSTFSSQARSIDFSRGSISIAPSTKKSGVFRFLTLKEPSTSAWEEFAELQKREQALRGAQGKALPEKKLPETIPKVNSKWNGLPDHVQPPKSHKPWKGSLDLSRTTISRASRTSDESKGSDRPSSGHSSNSSRTVRKVNSKGSDKAESVKTVKSNKTITPTAAGPSRVGPAMSTESIPPASPAPASMPARSLFFAPEQTPPTYTSRTLLVPDRGNPSPPDSVYSESPTLPNFPKAPTSSPAGGSSTEKLSKPATAVDIAVSDEESIPIQDNVQTNPPSEHHRSTSDITLAPPSPVTPDLASPLGPHNYHNRFAGKKQYKHVEEIPQWPLPTKPDEVIILENESSPLMTGYQSHARGDSSSSVGSPAVQGFDFSQTDGPSDDRTEPTSPISPIPPSPVVRLRETSPKKAPPVSPSSTSRPMFPFKSKPLIAPAFLPGRVKTRPFDLDTIAESDAGSIRAPSLYIVPDANSSSASVITLKAEHGTKSSLARAADDSTLSSMQRLGLGGNIKRDGEYFMGPDGNWTTTEREVERKKGSLMGMFRRGG